MALWDQVRQFLALEPMQERSIDTFDTTTPLATQLAALQAQARPWRLPSISEALGVPAIQRAVTLISNTAGSLAIEAYRSGVLTETPRVIARPDPFSTPRDSYGSMAYCLATRGETVLWIATRDGFGYPSALIVVPLNELTVDENPRNRMLPQYTWGDKKGTRYSPANPNGRLRPHLLPPRPHGPPWQGAAPARRGRVVRVGGESGVGGQLLRRRREIRRSRSTPNSRWRRKRPTPSATSGSQPHRTCRR